MPEKMSVDKRAALASLGARVVITPNAPPSSPENFRNVAERMAAEHGWFLTDQFKNPANIRPRPAASSCRARPGSWWSCSVLLERERRRAGLDLLVHHARAG